MGRKSLRLVLGIFTSIIALTAIGGGIAILAGAEDFPLEWLEGTPFRDFTIPALILIFVVGSSALCAAIMVFANHRLSGLISMAAGIVMTGEIGVELAILNQEPPGPHWIQVLYLGLGLIVFALGTYHWRRYRAGSYKM